jgi:nucleoside-diphosphate-sugar epimerase
MGPEDSTDRVWFYVQRILDGGPILVPATFPAPLRRHAYSEELARAYVMAADTPAAVDATYNVAMDEIVTLTDFVRLLADVMGKETEIVEVPFPALEAETPLSSYRPPFASRFVPDISRVQRDLRGPSTPIRNWLGLTAGWLIEHPSEDSTGYENREVEIRIAGRWGRSAR